MVSTADVPVLPGGPAISEGQLWYWDDGQGMVVPIDTASGTAGTPIKVGDPAGSPYGSPKTVAAGSSGVWATNSNGHSVDLIDPATNKIGGRIKLKPPAAAGVSKPVVPYGLAVDGDTLWVTDFDQGLLLEVSVKDEKVTKVISGLGHASAVTVGFGSVWVYEFREGTIARVDPSSGKVQATIEVQNGQGTGPCGGCANQLAVTADALWMPLGSGFGVAKIDPTTNADVATIPLTIVSMGIFADDSGVWVAGGNGGQDEKAVVVRIDPTTAKVTGTMPVPYAMNVVRAQGGGDLWVGTAQVMDSGSVVRIHLDN